MIYISEALLVCHGFSAAQDLSPVIGRCLEHLKHQVLLNFEKREFEACNKGLHVTD